MSWTRDWSSPRTGRTGRVLRIALPLLVAALLIGSLVAKSGLSRAELVSTLREVSPLAVGGILVSTALFLTLSSLKWRLVMARAAPQGAIADWTFSLYYTSLGALLSLVITPHAAMPISRSIGAKLHRKGSAATNAAASLYEQLFDVLPLVTMSLAALLAILAKAGFAAWLLIAAALNGTALLLVLTVLRSPFWKLARFLPLPARHREALTQKLEWFATPAAKSLLGAPFVSLLFAVSLARYAIILLRTGFVMVSIGLPITAFRFTEAYGVARLSSLVSFTPGELGISEWSWTGVLTWMGFRLDDAARFVLVNRAYNIGSLLAVFAFVWLYFWLAQAISSAGERRHPKEC